MAHQHRHGLGFSIRDSYIFDPQEETEVDMTLSMDTEQDLSLGKQSSAERKAVRKLNTRESCSTEHRKYSAKRK